MLYSESMQKVFFKRPFNSPRVGTLGDSSIRSDSMSEIDRLSYDIWYWHLTTTSGGIWQRLALSKQVFVGHCYPKMYHSNSCLRQPIFYVVSGSIGKKIAKELVAPTCSFKQFWTFSSYYHYHPHVKKQSIRTIASVRPSTSRAVYLTITWSSKIDTFIHVKKTHIVCNRKLLCEKPHEDHLFYV